MRRELIGSIAAIGLFAGSQALAIETTEKQLPSRSMSDIREWVVKNPPKPYRFREQVVVGATLPEDVTLAPAPETWGPELRSYHYVYGGDRVYLVEPDSRRVTYIIDGG
jgi:hypothetical protein